MLPAAGPNGHLPPGRYASTLTDIEAAYVGGAEFVGSATRLHVWRGFVAYLAAWRAVESQLDVTLLRAIWIGGSFISPEVDPQDIDVSPLIDEEALKSKAGQPGIGRAKSLIGNRTSITSEFHVEPFPVGWRSVPSTLFPDRLALEDQAYLVQRGGLDDWWGRVRPPGPKAAPTAPPTIAERGYLEVIF